MHTIQTKLLYILLFIFLPIQTALTDQNSRKKFMIQQIKKAIQDTGSYSPTADDASKALNYLIHNIRPLQEPEDATLRALKKYRFASQKGRVYPEARWANSYLFYDIFAGYLFIDTD